MTSTRISKTIALGIALIFSCMLLIGCGQKGDLYLPDKSSKEEKTDTSK